MGAGRRSVSVRTGRTGALLAAGLLAAVAGCSSGSTSNAVQTPSAQGSGSAGATVAAGSASAAPTASTEAVVTAVASPSPWTQERLAKAVSDHGGATRTANSNVITARVGAIFANSSSGDHFCTGSVVQSKGQSIVLTAAHCVDGGRNGGPNTDIVFVPGYRNGEKPQGQWPVRSVIVDQRWENDSDPDYDVAFLVLGTVNNQPIASVLGGNKLGIDLGFGRTVVLTGYPADQGEPIACFNTTTQQSAKQMKIACKSFPGGTSGSPWLTAFDKTTRTGTVIGVIGGYQEGGDTEDVSYSPYFDDDILALYNQAVAQGG